MEVDVTDEMLDDMLGRTQCRGTNAAGGPCQAPEHMVEDGLCPAHRPGGVEMMRERAALGGLATKARFEGQAFAPEDLPPLVTLEDAKAALDQVRVAVMSRRVTHAEGNAASKAVSEWVRTETAAITARLVGELKSELQAKAEEIEALRKQLATLQRERRAG